MIRTWDTSKEYLAELKQRRKELIAQYGSEGQKHPVASLIGGLNPAARELHMIREEIARVERANRKDKPEVTLTPLYEGISEKSKRQPVGLLYEMRTRNIARRIPAQLGKDNLGKFYIILRTGEEPEIVSDIPTIGDAKKELLKRLQF